MRHRHEARAFTLWIVLGASSGCYSYQRTAPTSLRPGVQQVSVTFRETRNVDGPGPGIYVTVAGVYGTLERVSGDTLFVRVRGGLDERYRPMRDRTADVLLPIAVGDAEQISAYRFSRGWTTAAILLGGLGTAAAIFAASVCIMCG